MGIDGDFSRQGPKFNCLWIILLSASLNGSPLTQHSVQRWVLEVKLLSEPLSSQEVSSSEKMRWKESKMVRAIF